MTYNQCPFCVDVDDNLLTQSVLIKAYLSASLFPPNILLPPPLVLLIYPPSLLSPKTFLSLWSSVLHKHFTGVVWVVLLPMTMSNNINGQFGDTTLTKVFVGGLAWETPKEALREHFDNYGEILEAVIISDKLTGRSKGYGFVSFVCSSKLH